MFFLETLLTTNHPDTCTVDILIAFFNVVPPCLLLLIPSQVTVVYITLYNNLSTVNLLVIMDQVVIVTTY